MMRKYRNAFLFFISLMFFASVAQASSSDDWDFAMTIESVVQGTDIEVVYEYIPYQLINSMQAICSNHFYDSNIGMGACILELYEYGQAVVLTDPNVCLHEGWLYGHGERVEVVNVSYSVSKHSVCEGKFEQGMMLYEMRPVDQDERVYSF